LQGTRTFYCAAKNKIRDVFERRIYCPTPWRTADTRCAYSVMELPMECRNTDTPADPFSPATTAVGVAAGACVILAGGLYTVWRLWCCCRAREQRTKSRGAKAPCCVLPLWAHPLAQLVGALRAHFADVSHTIRGFAARPWRRLVVAFFLQGCGAFAAAAIETTPASAAWQAYCRKWWERGLTRGLSTSVLLGFTEYAFTAVVPSAMGIERMPRVFFVLGCTALACVCIALAAWGIASIAPAGQHAVSSAFIVWLCALVLDYALVWPLLLLMSALVWADLPPMPRSTLLPTDAPASESCHVVEMTLDSPRGGQKG
jgi:hypothetical protein